MEPTNLDLKIFEILASSATGSPLRALAPWLGTLYFWIPALAFLSILILLYRPKQASLHALFGIGAYVIAYQVAEILARITQMKPPYLLLMDSEGALPAYYGAVHVYALPDWQITSMVAVHAFLMLRGRNMGMNLHWISGIYLWVFGLSRVMAGYCFPSGLIFGVALGMLIGWFCARVVRNIDLLQDTPEKSAAAPEAAAHSPAETPPSDE